MQQAPTYTGGGAAGVYLSPTLEHIDLAACLRLKSIKIEKREASSGFRNGVGKRQCSSIITVPWSYEVPNR